MLCLFSSGLKEHFLAQFFSCQFSFSLFLSPNPLGPTMTAGSPIPITSKRIENCAMTRRRYQTVVVGALLLSSSVGGIVDGFQPPMQPAVPVMAPSIVPGVTTLHQKSSSFPLRATAEDEDRRQQDSWDLSSFASQDLSSEKEERHHDLAASEGISHETTTPCDASETHDQEDETIQWYDQPEFKRKRRQRRQYLERATHSLLESEPGTLKKGKWHELASMLHGWSAFTKSETEAPVMMEQILKRLNEERIAGNTEAVVNIEMYNRLLDAWACAALFKTHRPEVASQRAREILVTLQENYESQGAIDLMPTQESFNLVLHCVCRIEGPTIARRLLALMEYLHRSGKNPNAKPSRQDCTLVLNGYALDRRIANAGALAEGFLRHMNITGGITPDTYCYNLAIKAYMNSKRGRESAEHANRILEEMEAPKDIITYSSVISAWATSGMRAHAVERAEDLLRQLEDHPELEPNTVVLNAVMSTWVKSRSPGACKRIQELVQEMEQSSEPTIRPDLISYNTYLHALTLQSKKPGFAQKADELLQKMENQYESGACSFGPNLFSYNLLIEAWSKSPSPDAAMRAAHVLRKLAKVQRPGVEPDTFSFNQVLAALSHSPMKGAAKMAEQLLWYMDKAYKNGIHSNSKPDAISFSSVIQAYARSGEAGAAVKAERLLQHMKERYYGHNETDAKPNRKVYNSIIHCWARSGEGTLGARKAEALMQEMQELREKYNDESMAPNLVTFNSGK